MLRFSALLRIGVEPCGASDAKGALPRNAWRMRSDETSEAKPRGGAERPIRKAEPKAGAERRNRSERAPASFPGDHVELVTFTAGLESWGDAPAPEP